MRKESNVQNCRDNELLVRGWRNKFNKVDTVVYLCKYTWGNGATEKTMTFFFGAENYAQKVEQFQMFVNAN